MRLYLNEDVSCRTSSWGEEVNPKIWRETMNKQQMATFGRVFGWIVFSLTVLASVARAQAPALDAGLISDFGNGSTTAKFGFGWVVSTDSLAGGKSTGEMKIVDGGANGHAHALEVSGLIDGGLPYAWAGVMFAPGSQPFVPVNLSSKKAITFWAKGDGQTYRVLLFTTSGGRIPAKQTFVVGSEWKRFSIPFSAFNGTDGHDVGAILFVGGPTAGKFDFEIDEIKLE